MDDKIIQSLHLLVKKSPEDFTHIIKKLNPTSELVEKIAKQLIFADNLKLMEILISEFNFYPTKIFINKEIGYRKFMILAMIQLIHNLSGINVFDIMEKAIIMSYLMHIAQIKNYQYQRDYFNKFISSDIKVNLTLSTFFLSHINKSNKYIFEYLMDNGMVFDINGHSCLLVKILYRDTTAFNFLLKYGFDFDIINKFQVPENFSKFKKIHQQLIDVGMNPLTIAYSLKLYIDVDDE